MVMFKEQKESIQRKVIVSMMSTIKTHWNHIVLGTAMVTFNKLVSNLGEHKVK